jgi:hypothetical protein
VTLSHTRTVNDGASSGQTGRFTPGQPDGLDCPSTGSNTLPNGQKYNPGRPPMIWTTGGGTPANNDPAKVGMDRILEYLCEDRGYSWCQPNVPWLLGNPTATDRIDDAVTWARANLGATDDPPILMGMSNGWVCAIVYARQFDVAGVVGLLPVTAGVDGYVNPRDDPVINGFGIRGHVEDAWGVTYPTMPQDGPILSGSASPMRWSPYDDALAGNYPTRLFGKVQMHYSCCDPLYASEQMAFGQMIRAELHNVGATGHLGTFDPSLASTEPADNVDVVKLADFVDRMVEAL